MCGSDCPMPRTARHFFSAALTGWGGEKEGEKVWAVVVEAGGKPEIDYLGHTSNAWTRRPEEGRGDGRRRRSGRSPPSSST